MTDFWIVFVVAEWFFNVTLFQNFIDSEALREEYSLFH